MQNWMMYECNAVCVCICISLMYIFCKSSTVAFLYFFPDVLIKLQWEYAVFLPMTFGK